LQSFSDCERAKGNGLIISGPVLALLAAACILAAGEAGAATHVETALFREADLRFERTGGRDLVYLEEARFLTRPGEPRLPAVPYRVALEPGSRVISVSISAADSLALAGAYDIMPAGAPQPLSGRAGGRYVPAGDSVFLMSEFYPVSHGEYVGAGNIDGVPIADIILYPVRYNPSNGALVLATEVLIEVEYEAGGGRVDESRAADADMIAGLVSASAAKGAKYKKKLLDLPYATISETEIDYIIITDSSLASSFQPLIDWKTRKGVPAAIVTLDEIDASYTGADIQERVRNCIADYHASYGTRWVLLGGDTGFIPERRLYVALSDKTSIPSDLYYADLDGTWNDDADLRWGEVPADGVDMYADVYVGRAPVSTDAEAGIFVEKVLAYEGVYGSPGDHLKDMLFLAEILWGELGDPSDPDYTDGGDAKDIIEASYVPGDFTVLKLYESLYNLTEAAIVAALNDGMGMVNVNCHGAVTGIALGDDNLPAASVFGLTNGPEYGILYATSCMVGAYEQSCIGEAWVRSPAGGGFFIGNSRYGWGVPGSPGEGPSDHYDQSFFEAVFVTGLENLGKVHAYAKHEYVAESRYDPYYRYVMYGLNLFGDPETPVWTGQPAGLAVEFPVAIPCGGPEFQVSVTSGGSPVMGTTVCLYKPGDVYVVGSTGALGAMTFYIEPEDTGTLYVTVTGAGYVPYLGTSNVEVADAGLPDGRGETPFSLVVQPNPFRSRAVFTVTSEPGTEVDIEIFDIRGRSVAAFGGAASASGVASMTWDGRDPWGRRVSPGIYVVRVSNGSAAATRKVLMIR
jgi:hypothetical protein